MKLQFGINFFQAIDHQKDVTKKVTKAKPVIVKDELTSTTKTKAKPDVDKDELTAKVSVIYLCLKEGKLDVYILFLVLT